MFVVNDLERLQKYGFEKTGEQNANGMCDVDYGEDVYSEAIWAFDEVVQMLRDGVIEWVESTPS